MGAALQHGGLLLLCLHVCVTMSAGSMLTDLFITVTQKAEVTDECLEMAERGDCSFYRECFYKRFPCMMYNYAITVGEKYCRKFDEKKSHLTSAARAWVEKTRTCSMKKMAEFYQQASINCKNTENVMKEAHATCEVEGGACDGAMLFQNKDVLTDIYKFDFKTLSRLAPVAEKCGLDEEDVKQLSSVLLPWIFGEVKTALGMSDGSDDVDVLMDMDIQKLASNVLSLLPSILMN